jgi:hypothetical protein
MTQWARTAKVTTGCKILHRYDSKSNMTKLRHLHLLSNTSHGQHCRIVREKVDYHSYGYDVAVLTSAVQEDPLPHNLGAKVEHFYLHGVHGLASELIAAHLNLPVVRPLSDLSLQS